MFENHGYMSIWFISECILHMNKQSQVPVVQRLGAYPCKQKFAGQNPVKHVKKKHV